jgi:hypothetical protein
MSILQMSEEEKKKISEQHKNAVKKDNDKKTELKQGLKQPEKKEDKKSS